MASTHEKLRRTVTRELEAMNTAQEMQIEAYRNFLAQAQTHNWEAAEVFQLKASAYLDASMDAMVRACRAQEKLRDA